MVVIVGPPLKKLSGSVHETLFSLLNAAGEQIALMWHIHKDPYHTSEYMALDKSVQ